MFRIWDGGWPTRRIAEMTDLSLPLGQLRIPHFPVPDGHTVESWLRAECQAGLERRYGTVTPALQARLGGQRVGQEEAAGTQRLEDAQVEVAVQRAVQRDP